VFRPVTRHGQIGLNSIRGHGIALTIKRAVFRTALADGLNKATACAMASSGGSFIASGLRHLGRCSRRSYLQDNGVGTSRTV
jgi:hypothetical protein